VNDPTASLSAERRGALSLPDIESCFGDPARYGLKVRIQVYRVEVACFCWFQCRLHSCPFLNYVSLITLFDAGTDGDAGSNFI
jgi:hypothetical protein